jgi:Kef-type K+ transport system membrane component KefB
MKLILLIGIVLLVGPLAGRTIKRFGIPQVVGFILTGAVLGDSFLGVLDRQTLDSLTPLTSLALALIGFMVGAELKQSVFKRYGRQFFAILFSEGLASMGLVALFVTVATGNVPLGILLGALASATAPAATVDVLWEYQARGPVTTTTLAIVALDDGLSLILYGFAIAVADLLTTGATLNWQVMLYRPLYEIGLSVITGLAAGFLIDLTLKVIRGKADRLVFSLGSLMCAAGIAESFGFSLILTSMTAGVYVTNIHPHRNESVFESLKSFAPPIYILFFVFVGARLQVEMLRHMGFVGILYVVGRTAGKWLGSYFGAAVSDAPATVRKYLGFTLFSQAGVAIGLALDAYQHFHDAGPAGAELGLTIINVIAATTFLVQIIGPPSVKFAITRAGEIGTKT